MTQALLAAANTLHALATVIFVGHYLLLSAISLPVLAAPALGEVSRRSRPWLYAAMLLLAVTGSYLTLVDPNYRGLGNFDGTWAILMLVKHGLMVVMFALGFWFNAVVRVGTLLRSNSGAAQGLAQFRVYSHAMSVCGIGVLLLTAIAQVI